MNSIPLPGTSGLRACRRLGLALVASVLLPVAAASAQAGDDLHADHQHAPAHLVSIVRQATAQYVNVNDAVSAGYARFLGCVSGPDHGAMGVHYVNGALLNGELHATQPQALIYEPNGGRMKLVGVEYIVDAAGWLKTHDGPPVLQGQTFQLVNSPNRYNIPSFFELHVWAWRDNPNGAFVDWNNRVSCDGAGK